MSFPAVRYFIYGLHSFVERPVARSRFEDHSLLPKQIWLLPPGTPGVELENKLVAYAQGKTNPHTIALDDRENGDWVRLSSQRGTNR
ncbi:hypothetical protein TWF281_008514 [Arthrobotrys megalospora]